MKLIDVCKKIDVWNSWLNSYKKYVPKFIEEAKHKANWKDWDNEVFKEYFERAREQCVSSLRQGYFTNNEKAKIKENWGQIAPILKDIAESQDAPLWDSYLNLQKVIRGFTDSNRKAATYRMIAGLQPNLLCTVINEDNLRQVYKYIKIKTDEEVPNLTNNWFRDSHNIFQLFKKSFVSVDPIQLATYPWQIKVHFDSGPKDQNNNDMSEDTAVEILELLKYKKQIILQGPPGTGKTRLAEQVAKELISSNTTEKTLTEEIISGYMKPGLKFTSAKDKLEYKVKRVSTGGVSVVASTGKIYTPTYKEIIDAFEKRIWEVDGAIKNGNDSYSAGIAKYIDMEQEKSKLDLSNSNEFKFIQFHPSYTYEDFVRGIVAKPNPEGGEGVFYEAINKTLGQFAKEAHGNFNRSLVENIEVNATESFESFLSHVLEEIDVNEKYMISEKVYIFYADDKRFKYKGDNWTAHPNGLNMNYSEFQKIISLGLVNRQDINKSTSLNALTRQHATYFQNVVELYKKYVNKIPVKVSKKTALKNYVLIIDEINRANLSSVLGELIYALEYRGKAVESMYEVETDGEKSNQLVLPPNLYIIGTMNTADRSVGHIDYAVRRRFGFVDVLPENLADIEDLVFHGSVTRTVSFLN